MQDTESRSFGVEAWRVESLPGVDDVRPARCRRCGRPSRRGRRVVLHGHGVRLRTVVVLPALSKGGDRLCECWQRRYRCTACGAVAVVLPAGVMPRCLYSTAAVVVAFFLTAAAPLGRGHSHDEAYRRQGMYSRLSTGGQAEPCWRWRSLDRWAAMAGQWWPQGQGFAVSSLLVGWIERSGGGGLAGQVRAALDSHVGWEGAV